MHNKQFRPRSNLVIPPHLMMAKKNQRARFFYFYNHGFKGGPDAFFTRVWASVFFPSLAHDPEFGKSGRKVLDEIRKNVPASYLRLRKIEGPDPHFEADIPVFKAKRSEPELCLEFVRRNLLGGYRKELPDPTAETLAEQQDLAEMLHGPVRWGPLELDIPVEELVRNLRLDQAGRSAFLTNCRGLRIEGRGENAVFFLRLRIEREEAQQLTTTEWATLRTIDLYPLMHSWVGSVFGAKTHGVVPVASFPISRIAMGLPKDQQRWARTNEHGLTVTHEGKPAFLPRDLDVHQTIIYEQRYAAAGTNADGSFALDSVYSQGSPRPKLPDNMVVCLDWVNNKFSYTTTGGNLAVLDLSRTRIPDATHIVNMLGRTVTERQFEVWLKLAGASGLIGGFGPTPAEYEAPIIPSYWKGKIKRAITDPGQYFKNAVSCFESKFKTTLKMSDLASNSEFPPFRPIGRFLERLEQTIRENLDAVYTRYSVSTVTEELGNLILIGIYAPDLANLREADERNRNAALTQGVDPNWKLPACPLIRSDLTLIPHQWKITNILKGRPDAALIPVQAGGGKTVLGTLDILYDMIEANPNGPYLVQVPSHLVANYVKEISYFTKGHVNVVPMTSTSIRQSGLARLQQIIRSAPVNTVVVVDYDLLRYRQQLLTYGTTPIKFWPIIDFLRQFVFNFVILDESHRIKRAQTIRARTCAELITDIRAKRLMSGTMIHDSPSDLAGQMAPIDPTVFGTRSEFNQKFAISVRGDRVTMWKPGAQRQIMDMIMERVVYAPARRKEWAALLPTKYESIQVVQLRPKQQEVYEELLANQLKKLRADSKSNAAVQKFLDSVADLQGAQTSVQDVQGPDEEDEEDITGEDIETAIRPYLAVLERFLISPNSVVPGRLHGDDQISPKTLAILNRVRLHIDGGTTRGIAHGRIPGKVLIFTNNVESAEEIFRRATPDLQKRGLLYKAEHKLEHAARFEYDDSVDWMVGVEQSMNEGLNFQVASRRVRAETPWNPGTQEQGDSRVNRPELKKEDLRTGIYFDSVVADRTIDITKQARLIAKIIAAEKFENVDNPEYEKIPDVPIVYMTLKSISKFNSWESEGPFKPGLQEYAEALREYEKIRNADYAQYRAEFVAKFGTNFRISVPVSNVPQGSALMYSLPYAPGLSIWGQAEQGLTRIDEYLSIVDYEGDTPDLDLYSQTIRERALGLKGQKVHTEFGDGVIARSASNSGSIVADLFSGYSVQVRRSQAFLIDPRSVVGGADVRQRMLERIGLPVIGPVSEIAESLKAPRGMLKRLEERKRAADARAYALRERESRTSRTAKLGFIRANGYLGIEFVVDEVRAEAIAILQNSGFKAGPQLKLARVDSPQVLKRQLRTWRDLGFTMSRASTKFKTPEALRYCTNLMEAKKMTDRRVRELATSIGVPNVFELEFKATADERDLSVFPVVRDHQLYLAMPVAGQAGNRKALANSIKALDWQQSQSTLSFFGSAKEVAAKLRQVQNAGLLVSNIDRLRTKFGSLKTLY